jgi:hypothetical protein
MIRIKYEIYAQTNLSIDEMTPEIALDYIKQHITFVACPESFIQYKEDNPELTKCET